MSTPSTPPGAGRPPGYAVRSTLDRLSPRQRQYALLAAILGGGIGLLWLIVLLATTSSHPLKQGVHDRAANSIVVQPLGTSSKAAVVGCFLLVVLVFVVLPIIALVAFGEQFEQILSEVGQSI